MSNPSFPVVTLAVWGLSPETPIADQLNAKSAEMASQGKTDDVPEFNKQTEQLDVRRNWLDTSAANEWVSYVQSVGGDLVSIAIEN
jgi:hypothetical protein